MKKLTVLFLAVIIFLQMSIVSVEAESSKRRKLTLTISNIDTSMLDHNSSRFTTEIKIDGVATSSFKIIGEKWKKPDEFVISSKDVPLPNGVYSYELTIRTDGTLNFNNDLEIYYQGIDGQYQLDYTIDETDNHIMIVTGLFENIITESPALETLPEKGREWVLANFSDDSYYYQLNLRTQEGFTFTNRLQFLFKSIPCVYSVDFMYDLLKDMPALRVNGSIGSEPDYYRVLVAEKANDERLADNADRFHQHLENVAAVNKEILSKAAENAEKFTGISKEETVNRIEEIVTRHKEILNNIDPNEFKDRMDSFFGSFVH